MTEKNPLDNKRILIVDDEPDVLETLEELLSMCDIVKATSFEEAKERLENEYFDMAILDIMGVDGFKLLEIAKGKGVIALMLTAHGLKPENIVRSFKGGAASYLPKEEMADIVTFLNEVLEAKAEGKHFWWRWLDRWGSYFDKRFGPDWKEEDKEFWEKYRYYV